MLGGSDDSSYMDAFVTLSTPGQLTTLGERATTPLVTECNTVVGSESIISMITESAASIRPPRVGGTRSAQTCSEHALIVILVRNHQPVNRIFAVAFSSLSEKYCKTSLGTTVKVRECLRKS